MPILLLINGPPGIGKSTIARRYVDAHPLALCLDVDVVRSLVGGWEQHQQESGAAARRLAVGMAREHLVEGHDVVVPQFLGLARFAQQLAELAAEVGADMHELVLLANREEAVERFHARAGDPALRAHHEAAVRLVGGDAGLATAYERVLEVMRERPHTVVIPSARGDVEGTYAEVLRQLPRR